MHSPEQPERLAPSLPINWPTQPCELRLSVCPLAVGNADKERLVFHVLSLAACASIDLFHEYLEFDESAHEKFDRRGETSVARMKSQVGTTAFRRPVHQRESIVRETIEHIGGRIGMTERQRQHRPILSADDDDDGDDDDDLDEDDLEGESESDVDLDADDDDDEHEDLPEDDDDIESRIARGNRFHRQLAATPMFPRSLSS